MISYEPLWRTMKKRNATTYTLRKYEEPYKISGSTIRRLKANQSVSTNALDSLCHILDCNLCDIIEYKPDKQESIE